MEKDMPVANELKREVQQHWEMDPCNTRYARFAEPGQFFRELRRVRYAKEPNILELAKFEQAKGLRVLEIGIGAGIDFERWVRHGANSVGVDFTAQGISLTKQCLESEGHRSDSYLLLRADAESLPFEDESFDIVYSYGVLHHTPDTQKAFQNAFRVLREGGKFKCMIYHSPSWTTINLWLYHGLLKLRPWKSLKQVAFQNLESPGTKTYTVQEALDLAQKAGFSSIRIKLFLDCGDLLDFQLGKKYEKNLLVRAAVRLYPRWLVQWLDGRKSRLGTTMHIEGIKGWRRAGRFTF